MYVLLNIYFLFFSFFYHKHNSITMDTNVNFLRGCFPNTAESKIKEILNAENISGNVDLAVSELLNHSVKKSIKNFQEPFLTKLQKEGQGRGNNIKGSN